MGLACYALSFRYQLRLNDQASYRFMGCKSATAINIPALVITFFGFFSQIATRSGVRCMSAQRAMHHFSFPYKTQNPLVGRLCDV